MWLVFNTSVKEPDWKSQCAGCRNLRETGSVCVSCSEGNRTFLPPFFFSFSLLFLPVVTRRGISRRKLGALGSIYLHIGYPYVRSTWHCIQMRRLVDLKSSTCIDLSRWEERNGLLEMVRLPLIEDPPRVELIWSWINNNAHVAHASSASWKSATLGVNPGVGLSLGWTHLVCMYE